MSTAPDYAGLIERLLDFDVISEPFEPDDAVKAWNYLVGRAHEAATAIRTLLSNYKTAQANWELALESNAALERERTNLIETKREQIDRLNTRIAKLEKTLEQIEQQLDYGQINMALHITRRALEGGE